MGAKREKIEFQNKEGITLAGALELPEQEATSYALFAHCFACSKDMLAATRISRALAKRNIAVLRFDFTGLGKSDGDFANTNFSSNVGDILAAVSFLREKYQAPQLLIGHSLGGAAVLHVASEVPELKGVVTIGAPSDPEHVKHNFAVHEDEIKEKGYATVNLGSGTFTIKKQFLEDISNHDMDEEIGRIRAALLIFHSPTDETVELEEAAKIYKAAKHPKSFISLDKADHLLTKGKDADYVAETISAWASRYITD